MKLIKTGILIFISGIFSYYSYSQYFDGGISLGFTTSQIDGDTYSGYHQPGLTGGIYTSRQFNNNFKGVLELKYIAKGARETGGKDEPTVYEQKLRYIEVPVKINYHFKKYKSDVETGICTGYLFKEKIAYNLTDYGTDKPNKKIEISWNIGAGYHINESLFLSVQFNYSILPIRQYENSDYNYGFFSRTFWLNKGDYNNVIQFVIYYQISKQ